MGQAVQFIISEIRASSDVATRAPPQYNSSRFAGAFCSGPTPPAEESSYMPSVSQKRSLFPILAATLVLLVAAYLRLHQLADVPFGWHPDEATKGVIAWEILLGQRPLAPFYTQFTGREPLYIFLESLAIALIGRTTFAVRAMTAFVGMLTVAGTYHLGRRVFNRRVGWVAAGLIAASLWQVIASRNGYRAVLQPLVQLPALVFLWRGLRSGRTRDFALAGAFVGLAQYTYSAARFFPVMMLLFGIGTLVARRDTFMREFPRWVVMGGVALAVFAPLGIYFVQNPGDLLNRANQISVFNTEVNGGDTLSALRWNLRDTARMFGARGDLNFRFNLSGRPVFTLPEMILFVLGLLLSAWQLVRRKGLERLAYLLLCVWLLVMLLPMVLTVEGIPYFQRALGIVPAVYFFPALALDWLLSLVPQKRADKSVWRWVERGGMASALLVLALVVRREYFVEWNGAALGWDDRRLEMTQLAEYINDAAPEEPPYISTDQGLNPVMLWYAPEYFFDLRWFDASRTMVYPPPGVEVEYIFAAQTVPNPALIEMATDLELLEEVLDPFGRVAFTMYRWPADGQPPAPQVTGPLYWSAENTYPELQGEPDAGVLQPIEAPVDVAHDALFLGYDLLQDEIIPGGPLEVALHWRTLNVPDHPYTIFAHLIDAETETYANGDNPFYLTLYWSVGETFTSYHVLWTSEGMLPGDYLLQLGMYNPETGERATVYDEAGIPVDARLLAGPISIE
jgi:4-amino-4-deoxy-L-arabinose transferase-like glycosyltransferase